MRKTSRAKNLRIEYKEAKREDDRREAIILLNHHWMCECGHAGVACWACEKESMLTETTGDSYMSNRAKIFGVCAGIFVFAITMVVGAPSAEAASKKNETKASIGVLALCDLDNTDDTPRFLLVDLYFTEQSSGGDPGAEVREWTVQGIQKGKGNWSNATLVGAKQKSGPIELDPDGLVVKVPPIDLCDNDNNPLLDNAKAVNADITITYGSADSRCDEADPDPDLCGDREIIMNCSPNPDRDGQGGVSVVDISCPGN